MTPRLALPAALLIAATLSACNQKAADQPVPAPKGTAQSAQAEPSENELQKKLEQIATQPLRLFSEKVIPYSTIAANGDFIVLGAAVAIDDTQRAQLVAYRQQLLIVVQSGVEIGDRSQDFIAEKLSELVGDVFEDEPTQPDDTSKSDGADLKAAGKRICDTLPLLLKEQDALVAVLPEFRPYAHFDQADVASCRGDVADSRKTGETIGKTVGVTIGNPITASATAGAVAGFMAALSEKSHKANQPNIDATTPKNDSAGE